MSPPHVSPPLPILIVAAFLSGAGMRVADPLLAAIATGFGATISAAAATVAAFTFAYGIAQPVLGPLGDRFGKLRLIAACMACYGAATVASAAAPSLEALILLRAVAGAFAGGLIPVAIALIGDTTPYGDRQATLGRFMTGMVFANLTAAPLAGLAGDIVGWQPVFAALGALALAAALPLWRVARAAAAPAAHAHGSALARMLGLLRRPAARRLFLLVAVEGAVAFGAPPFLGAFLVEGYGFSYSWAGVVLGAAGLGALLYTRIAGRLVRRFGEKGLLAGGGLGLVVWLGAIAAAPPPALLMPVSFLGGLALVCFHGVLQARGSEIAPESRATGMAAFAFSLFVGQAIGAAIAGLALPALGFQGLFAAATAVMAMLAVAARLSPAK
ncbi:MFS transporter [Elioraea rosea]|uniref:MFS transporter n=1 Tax=Elioraea rosea TaxID=2492390 RepID=UPI001184F249|nr:MFS transporter [Elioraea rosea]